jgi:hypothetical protein
MLCAAPMTAYALTDEDAEQEIDLSELLIPVVTPEPTPTPEPQPLTPPGNLTLVDDFSGEAASDKQFITVITKNGNYFYIVIDRADNKENVHFLNLVDEADLLALMEDEQKPAPINPAPVQTTPAEPTPEPEPEPEPQKRNTGGILLMVLLVGAIGGGAYYYFKILKPKQATKGTATTELDEFAFDEDEDEFDGAVEYEPDSVGHEDGDGGDMPDFTALEPPDPDSPLFDYGDQFTFESTEFGADTPESEEK